MSSTLLKEELCCKCVLKHGIKNYLRQFPKNLSIRSQRNTAHTDLVMCNMFDLND